MKETRSDWSDRVAPPIQSIAHQDGWQQKDMLTQQEGFVTEVAISSRARSKSFLSKLSFRCTLESTGGFALPLSE
jgi:hypothetical protein